MLFVFSLSVFADEAPVVDLTQNQNNVAQSAPQVPIAQTLNSANKEQQTAVYNSNQPMNLSIDERIARLEQQISYMQQLNLPASFAKIQQSLADLRGLIDIQGHQIKQLEDQQRRLYADLDQRISTTAVADNASPSVAPTKPAAVNSVSSQTAKAASDEETQAYNDAIKMITDKKYTAATPALQKYLRKYPAGQYVANAHYWLGELYAIAGNNSQAVNEFNIVVKNYANTSKAADSLLKLASMAFNKAEFNQAKQYWQMIVQKYPNSSAARIANMHLQKLVLPNG